MAGLLLLPAEAVGGVDAGAAGDWRSVADMRGPGGSGRRVGRRGVVDVVLERRQRRGLREGAAQKQGWDAISAGYPAERRRTLLRKTAPACLAPFRREQGSNGGALPSLSDRGQRKSAVAVVDAAHRLKLEASQRSVRYHTVLTDTLFG